MEYLQREYRSNLNFPSFVNFLFSSDRNEELENLKEKYTDSNTIINELRLSPELRDILLFSFYPAVYDQRISNSETNSKLTLVEKKRLFPHIEDNYVYNPAFIKLHMSALSLHNFSISEIDIGDRINNLDYINSLSDEKLYLVCFNRSVHRDVILKGIERDRVYYPIIDGRIQNMDHYSQDLLIDRTLIRKGKYLPKIVLAAFNEIGRDAIHIAIESIGNLNLIINKEILELEGIWELVTKYRCSMPVYSSGISKDRAVELVKSCPHLYRLYKGLNCPELKRVMDEICHVGMTDYEGNKRFVISSSKKENMKLIKDLSSMDYFDIDCRIKKRLVSIILYYFTSQFISIDNTDKDFLQSILNSPTLMKILYKYCNANNTFVFEKIPLDGIKITDEKAVKYYMKYSKKYGIINLSLIE